MKNMHKNQAGAATIMIAMVLTIVITLIVIGFSTLTRNDQTQTLDKTLSSQAQYAAESKINEIAAKLKDPSVVSKPYCGPSAGDNTPEQFVNAGTYPELADVMITCATYNVTPTTLHYANLNNGSPKQFIVKPSDTTNATKVRTIIFRWKPKVDTCTVNSNSAEFFTSTSLSSGNGCPVLRITISRQDAASQGKIFTGYSIPTSGTTADARFERFESASNPNGGYQSRNPTGNQASGEDDSTNCGTSSTDRTCMVAIRFDATNWWTNGNYGLVSVAAIGGDIKNLEIKAYANTVTVPSGGAATFPVGTEIPLINAQAMVDVTAKSGDTIKRIVAYPSTDPDGETWEPGAAALANQLCKNYQVDGTQGTAGTAAAGAFCY
jgi:Tfp pilus assembly protein PilX